MMIPIRDISTTAAPIPTARPIIWSIVKVGELDGGGVICITVKTNLVHISICTINDTVEVIEMDGLNRH